jgi:hypothetical protein
MEDITVHITESITEDPTTAVRTMGGIIIQDLITVARITGGIIMEDLIIISQ